MPDKDIQDFDAIASADGADYALIIDTSDTTDDPGGSLKKVLVSNGGAGGITHGTDTVTVSAATSGSWAIPDGCIRAHVRGVNLTGNASTMVWECEALEASGGAAGQFRTDFGNFPHQGYSAGYSSLTDHIGNFEVEGGYTFSVDIVVEYPRSSTEPTLTTYKFTHPTGSVGRVVLRTGTAIGTSAEDHDTLNFLSTLSYSGTFYITYTVQA